METITNHDGGLSAIQDDYLSEDVNIPVTDTIDQLRVEIAELKEMLAPIAPILESLPELMGKVDPFLEELKKSPVLKMLGVKL